MSTKTSSGSARRGTWRDLLQEALELGPAQFAFRVRWELALRSGWVATIERPPGPVASPKVADALLQRLPFAVASEVRAAIADRIGPAALSSLASRASDAGRGRIRCFGRWFTEFGYPIQWDLNPVARQRWDPFVHWTAILKDTGRVGDVKLTWEVGRFPQAYDLARAAALGAMPSSLAAESLVGQIADFVERNRYGRGVHWASGQEIVIRLVAWLFAASVLRDEPQMRGALPLVTRHLYEGAIHLDRYFEYAQKAVNNNHLVSEALGLYLSGVLLPQLPDSSRWIGLGLGALTEQAARQVYEDGGYIMHSHTYHRATMQMYLLAGALRRKEGKAIPAPWRSAMERSLDFLLAHQNPTDGRLPNYGSNDGALPLVLSTCDYSDFRPLLQALSLAARGERLYEPGPWDEEAAWVLGPAALAAPMRAPRRVSVSFASTGCHVLRGRDEGTFACFRCGTLRDRFSQIDMLHVDVFWRGENVLVDGGTYLYNGPQELHRHFTSAASHNTVTVDGRDQMVHHRRFKVLYLTTARLLRFEDAGAFTVADGEHDAYRRHPGRCVHRRSVLHVKDDLWVVADRVHGAGKHSARLHWLAGPYVHRYEAAAGLLVLETPAGTFTVTVCGADARPMVGDVVAGAESPPRGWYSRYYGEKVPVPSLSVIQEERTPVEFVSVLAAGRPAIDLEGDRWRVDTEMNTVHFRIREGRLDAVTVTSRREH